MREYLTKEALITFIVGLAFMAMGYMVLIVLFSLTQGA